MSTHASGSSCFSMSFGAPQAPTPTLCDGFTFVISFPALSSTLPPFACARFFMYCKRNISVTFQKKIVYNLSKSEQRHLLKTSWSCGKFARCTTSSLSAIPIILRPLLNGLEYGLIATSKSIYAIYRPSGMLHDDVNRPRARAQRHGQARRSRKRSGAARHREKRDPSSAKHEHLEGTRFDAARNKTFLSTFCMSRRHAPFLCFLQEVAVRQL